MAKIQEFNCKEDGCNEKVEYSFSIPIAKSIEEIELKETNAYLTCAKGHTNPYKVTVAIDGGDGLINLNVLSETPIYKFKNRFNIKNNYKNNENSKR